MRKRVDLHVVMQKVIANVSPEQRRIWNVPEEHQAVGLISSDCEDVMWLAVDDATKKSKIQVLHIETVYGGVQYSWSKFGGEITAVISGPKVSDVKSGLSYIRDYVENHSGNYIFDEEGTLGCYVDLVPRVGKYYSSVLDVAEGEAIAYLVSTPVESTYGIDKALKASNARLVDLFETPSRVNTGGAILAGTESACKAAVEAFMEAVEYCAYHPMDLE